MTDSKSVLDRFHDRRERFLDRWHERRAAHFVKRDARHARRDARHARRDDLRAGRVSLHHDRPRPERPTLAQTLRESLHLILDLPIGIATFTLLVTAVSTGLSTLVIIVGFPILVATGVAVRWVANLERARLRLLLEADALRPATWPGTGEPFLRRVWTCAKDPTVWKEAFYEVALMPWGIATFTTTVVVWGVAFGGVLYGAYAWALPGAHPWYEYVGYALLGVVMFVIGPWIIHGVALLGRAMGRALLGVSTRELTAKVEHLSTSRQQSVDAATAERQRIERALHDGAQVRLTALAMELGQAKERLDTDPEGARELLDRAHDDAKRALVELRDLARGIHPAILTDRGLDAALTALAARSPIPVEVVVDLDDRPTPALEATAYYVAAEGIANVIRHSGATRARVSVNRSDGHLAVEVQDDGRGGARIAEPNGVVPTGLRGLADRVAGVDGELAVSSPPGGPTVLRAELPCGS